MFGIMSKLMRVGSICVNPCYIFRDIGMQGSGNRTRPYSRFHKRALTRRWIHRHSKEQFKGRDTMAVFMATSTSTDTIRIKALLIPRISQHTQHARCKSRSQKSRRCRVFPSTAYTCRNIRHNKRGCHAVKRAMASHTAGQHRY